MVMQGLATHGVSKELALKKPAQSKVAALLTGEVSIQIRNASVADAHGGLSGLLATARSGWLHGGGAQTVRRRLACDGHADSWLFGDVM